ncbi:MAG: YgiQ family radical SAM protein [Clostridia bacterium]|nr:YgiQ family radical SAM protein [Clostridia bacterium]
MPFLPVKREEFEGVPDFVLVSADAYVDHPSFGMAVVSRVVEHEGFSVCIVPQPQCDADYCRFGAPRHAFLVSSGVCDSMVDNYTVAKNKRTEDVYSEGGKPGMRPDRAVTVYCKNLKRLFPDTPVLIGGIEASLRRFAHYDYWADRVMPSVLVDSGADLLMYGMGERTLKELLSYVRRGVPIGSLRDVRGTCYLCPYDGLSKKLQQDLAEGKAIACASYEDVCRDKVSYCKAFNVQSENCDPFSSKVLLQKHGARYVVQNLPQLPLSPKEMDEVYALPYMRTYHPMYSGGVPAIEEVEFSITSVRGCYGSCSYCALTYHQGRIVQKRSKESIVGEAEQLVKIKGFKGYIHDVGGPTANFRDPACRKQMEKGACKHRNCIGYEPCDNLQVDHREYLDILEALRRIEGVKKVFVRSGVRFDYVMLDKDDTFLRELIKHHVSGQLKVAPEHSENGVLKLMNKPPFEVYKAFKNKFDRINKELGMQQYLVPYLISSHPGCTLRDAVKLAEYLHSINYMPKQVQDFYPTPSTKSTCMYYTEMDPDTLKPVFVPKSKEEKQMQRALLQYRKPQNYAIVKAALLKANRTDLIGYGARCLISPYPKRNNK